MPARDPAKPPGYYCDAPRHKKDCADKNACPGCESPCSARAGQGCPDHVGVGNCWRHGGRTPSHKVAAAVELQRQAVARYGLPVDIDPAEAMMQAVRHSYGQVLYMRAVVAGLEQPWQDGDDGARPHVAWVMLKAEEKHHVDVCRDALRAGVERRALELMEDEARRAVAVLEAFAAALGLDRSEPRVLEAGRVALAMLPGGG